MEILTVIILYNSTQSMSDYHYVCFFTKDTHNMHSFISKLYTTSHFLSTQTH